MRPRSATIHIEGSTIAEIGLILLAFGALIAFVDPRGNFPLNDDWDFGLATFWFARTGEFQFTPLTAVSLRTQVLWGALWTRLFGESFTILRASTLLTAAGTLVMVNRILHYAGAKRTPRVVATLALMVHPLFFWNAFTYMTHVPYLFVSTVVFYSFCRGVREDHAGWMVAGSVATFAVFYIRQWGVSYAIAVLALLVLFRARLSPRWKLLAVPPAAVVVLFGVLYKTTGGLAGSPAEFNTHYRMWFQESFGVAEALTVAYRYTLFSLQTEALFFLPLLVPAVAAVPRKRVAIAAGLLAALTILPGVWMLWKAGQLMPYWAVPYCCDIFPGNIFINFGLGPPTLRDVWDEGRAYPFGLGLSARFVLTCVATTAAISLLTVLAVRVWSVIRQRVELTALTAYPVAHLVAGMSFLCIAYIFLDRYSLDAFWTLVILLPLLGKWSRTTVVSSVLCIVAIGTFSALATQEYLRWNRARWQAVNDLLRQGIAIERVDAGQEVWKYLAHDKLRNPKFRPTGEYVVAFHRLPGYRVIASYPYQSFLGERRGSVVTMKRDAITP